MKLAVEFELSHFDGPLEFFGYLDGEFVYCEATKKNLLGDNREFKYWLIAVNGPGSLSLAESLSRPESGRFTSEEVEWKA